jgi:hypothetical protein
MNVVALLFSQAVFFTPQPDIFLEVVTGENDQTWAFLAPHENEHVVNQHVADKIMQHGGTFVVLRQHGTRHITLRIDGKEYEIDPNRIFTDRGRQNTLSRLNPELDRSSDIYEVALNRTEQLADFIMTTMNANQASSWIAIHNNTNGYDNDGKDGRGTISIKRYQKKLAEGANYLIKVNDAGIDEDNLFFITEPSDFLAMSDANWNVVLQNPEVANDPNEDDGSLSVLAEMRDKRYVNIEAERADTDGFGEDMVDEQKQMVNLMFELLLKEQRPDS